MVYNNLIHIINNNVILVDPFVINLAYMNKYNIFIDVKRIPSDNTIVSAFLQNRYLLLLYD